MHRIPRSIHFWGSTIANFGYLANFVIWFSTRSKYFSTKTFFVEPIFRIYAKNALPYKFRIFEKKIFELTILIFASSLTTATRKRVNSGGHPLNAPPQKHTHLSSTSIRPIHSGTVLRESFVWMAVSRPRRQPSGKKSSLQYVWWCPNRIWS